VTLFSRPEHFFSQFSRRANKQGKAGVLQTTSAGDAGNISLDRKHHSMNRPLAVALNPHNLSRRTKTLALTALPDSVVMDKHDAVLLTSFCFATLFSPASVPPSSIFNYFSFFKVKCLN
jgi:hypothetical protein